LEVLSYTCLKGVGKNMKEFSQEIGPRNKEIKIRILSSNGKKGIDEG
jgi:hypothetical protein